MVDGLDTLQRSMSLARLDSKPNLETVCSKDTGVSDSEAPTLVSMHSSGTTEVDSNPEAYAVLRVECIEARSLKVLLLILSVVNMSQRQSL